MMLVLSWRPKEGGFFRKFGNDHNHNDDHGDDCYVFMLKGGIFLANMMMVLMTMMTVIFMALMMIFIMIMRGFGLRSMNITITATIYIVIELIEKGVILQKGASFSAISFDD